MSTFCSSSLSSFISVKKIIIWFWSNFHSLYNLKEKLMHSKEGDRIAWNSKGCCNHSPSYLPPSLYGLEAKEGFFSFLSSGYWLEQINL